MNGLINGTISTKNTPNENIIAVFCDASVIKNKNKPRIVKRLGRTIIIYIFRKRQIFPITRCLHNNQNHIMN